MRILLLGAGGFIGSEIARALRREGHSIVGVSRDIAYAGRLLPEIEWRFGDLRHMGTADDWAPLLKGIDIVINASGALQDGLRDAVFAVQAASITTLADAARKAGTDHLIQISAVGAAPDTPNPFLASKALADSAIGEAGISHTILRPGLVIGRNAFGGSEMLRMAAGLPWVPIPADTGPIQCIAMADLVDAVSRVANDPGAHRATIELVARNAYSLAEIVAEHRRWLGFGPLRAVAALPGAALLPLTAAADALGWLGWRSPLRRNAIAVLIDGVTGDVGQTVRLLGREPLTLSQALAATGSAGKADRWHARMAPLYPLALVALLLLWLISGIVGLVRTEVAAQLLVDGGMSVTFARASVIGGSLADIAIAAGVAFRPTLALALKAGVALTLFYIAGSAIVRPDLWVDPLAPMLKTVPILMLSLLCLAMAGER